MKISHILYSVLLFVSLILTLSSCGNDEPIVQRPSEELIQEYLTANDITAQRTDSGIFYVIENAGGTEKPTATSVVIVDYHGYLLNGDVFDSSVDRGEPLQISLAQVIPGWTEGIQLFGKEGKGTLYIPSQLAYGTRGAGDDIPPNTPIAFDIELHDFR